MKETGAQDRSLAEAATAVVDAAVVHEQARRLQATMTTAFINRHELWLRHFSFGGNVEEFEIDAYLHHALLLPQFPQDLLAHAANEIVDDIPSPRASYTALALADRTSPTEDAGQDEATSPAAETGDTNNDDPKTLGPHPEKPGT